MNSFGSLGLFVLLVAAFVDSSQRSERELQLQAKRDEILALTVNQKVGFERFIQALELSASFPELRPQITTQAASALKEALSQVDFGQSIETIRAVADKPMAVYRANPEAFGGQLFEPAWFELRLHLLSKQWIAVPDSITECLNLKADSRNEIFPIVRDAAAQTILKSSLAPLEEWQALLAYIRQEPGASLCDREGLTKQGLERLTSSTDAVTLARIVELASLTKELPAKEVLGKIAVDDPNEAIAQIKSLQSLLGLQQLTDFYLPTIFAKFSTTTPQSLEDLLALANAAQIQQKVIAAIMEEARQTPMSAFAKAELLSRKDGYQDACAKVTMEALLSAAMLPDETLGADSMDKLIAFGQSIKLPRSALHEAMLSSVRKTAETRSAEWKKRFEAYLSQHPNNEPFPKDTLLHVAQHATDIRDWELLARVLSQEIQPLDNASWQDVQAKYEDAKFWIAKLQDWEKTNIPMVILRGNEMSSRYLKVTSVSANEGKFTAIDRVGSRNGREVPELPGNYDAGSEGEGWTGTITGDGIVLKGNRQTGYIRRQLPDKSAINELLVYPLSDVATFYSTPLVDGWAILLAELKAGVQLPTTWPCREGDNSAFHKKYPLDSKKVFFFGHHIGYLTSSSYSCYHIKDKQGTIRGSLEFLDPAPVTPVKITVDLSGVGPTQITLLPPFKERIFEFTKPAGCDRISFSYDSRSSDNQRYSKGVTLNGLHFIPKP